MQYKMHKVPFFLTLFGNKLAVIKAVCTLGYTMCICFRVLNQLDAITSVTICLRMFKEMASGLLYKNFYPSTLA